MKVYFGTDHAGYELKNKLIEYVRELGYEAEDCGAYEYAEGDDYPDFIIPCSDAVASDEGSLGIVLGSSGQGEAMCANRVKGVRAAVIYSTSPLTPLQSTGEGESSFASTLEKAGDEAVFELVRLAREHNNANILSLGAHFINDDEAKQAVKIFLETKFSGDERHVRRLNKF